MLDAVSAALPDLQRLDESLMITPCRVVEWSEVTADPVTGADVLVSGPTVYDGSCHITLTESQPHDSEVGTGTVTTETMRARLPVETGPYKVGYVVEILDDARSEVVRRLRVVGRHDTTWQTSQQLRVEET
jgi:hypothetical protein